MFVAGPTSRFLRRTENLVESWQWNWRSLGSFPWKVLWFISTVSTSDSVNSLWIDLALWHWNPRSLIWFLTAECACQLDVSSFDLPVVGRLEIPALKKQNKTKNNKQKTNPPKKRYLVDVSSFDLPLTGSACSSKKKYPKQTPQKII